MLIGVTACGGGDSTSNDSDAGSGNPDPMGLDGSYTGMQNLMLNLGGVSEIAELEALVTVTGNNILIDPLTANGSIANDTFVATTNRTSTQGGLTCQFLLTYRGDISLESLSGDITGTAICDQGEGNQTLNVTGSISATRN